jgi:hypothetical protein
MDSQNCEMLRVIYDRLMTLEKYVCVCVCVCVCVFRPNYKLEANACSLKQQDCCAKKPVE